MRLTWCGRLALELEVAKAEGMPLGAEVASALFDQVRTCDNHCEFCFIYQLPPGLRDSLYLKDDDYRLSFLYGNFTTLTRFTEADLERVVTEGLSPLHVSIHATDPEVRADLLRNRRGATSLRWLRALLDHGITVTARSSLPNGRADDTSNRKRLPKSKSPPHAHTVDEARRRRHRADWQDVFLRVGRPLRRPVLPWQRY